MLFAVSSLMTRGRGVLGDEEQSSEKTSSCSLRVESLRMRDDSDGGGMTDRNK